MRSFLRNLEQFCRLCGSESQDLVNLFENKSSERNLVLLIKKYVKVTVTVRDELPHQVCGSCIAKLDEVVEFVDVSLATQAKFRQLVKEDTSREGIKSLDELIKDVKVELDEDFEEQRQYDLSDKDYVPKGPRKRNCKTRGKRKDVNKSVKAVKVLEFMEVDPKYSRINEEEKNVRSTLLANEYHEMCEDAKRTVEIDRIHSREENYEEIIIPRHNISKQRKCKIPVRCCVCLTKFDHPEDLRAHCLEAHQLKEIRFMCLHCHQKFIKVSSMTAHMKKKHRDSLQKCPKCKKAYPSHYLWTRHMLVHTNTRPFTCDECHKKFKSKGELCNHKRTHRPCEERYTHCCEICGKRFTQKANLENHLKLHSGKRPFSCEFCGKTFSQRGNMEEHRRIHTGEKPFICDICGTRFSRQGQLSVHRKMHTGEKPHKCKYCQKEFLRKEVLRKHEHVHTDTRPYKCSYCEKCFRDQGKRKVHERLHTGERPYECQVCKRGFCESGNLKKHLRIHQRTSGTILSPPDEEVESRVTGLGAGSVIVASGDPSYNNATNPHSITSIGASCARQNLELVTMASPSLLIVSEPGTLVTEGSNFSSASLPPNPSLSIPMSSDTHVLNTSHSLNETDHRVDERNEYRVNSSVPFHSVTWTLYQAE